MGATYHYPEKISTASPFVATFPATNLLVFCIFIIRTNILNPTGKEIDYQQRTQPFT